MATLFDYVISSKMAGKKTKFWGKYQRLNNSVPPVPTDEMIHNYQLEKLKNQQQIILQSSRNRNKKFEEVEKLLYNNNLQEHESFLEYRLDQGIANIFNRIAELRQANKSQLDDGTYKDRYVKKAEIDLALMNLQQSIKNLQTKMKTTGIYDQDLAQLEKFIKKIKTLKTADNKTYKEWYKHLSSLQGELLEQIGISWFRERIPKELNINVVDTAKVRLNTSRTNRHSGSLIQDLLLIDMDNIDILDNKMIEFKIGTSEKKQVLSIKEFLNMLNNYANSSEQIIIEDDAYDILLNASVMGIQAKSGKTQLPWNVNKSTQLAISDFNYETTPGGHISVLETFILLNQLDQEVPEDQWVINSDHKNYYQALANYGLATRLYKVMHLDSKEGNQYLLTNKGIMTFYQRICELFGNNPKIIVRFSGSVFKNGRLRPLTDKYNVSIPWKQLI